MKESNTVNEPNDIQNSESSSQLSDETEPEAKRKPPKKRSRVSQRKELAVVTIGMVAITSFGGLLAGHQAQADESTNTAPPAQVSSPDPGASSSEQQPSKDDEAPAYSPGPQDNAPAKASHAQSQGS
ncbi:MAG: hypothetical protein M3305_01950 [Actinomycetota bacterium]|nr:hypothetical protein [Actinomycetota bacterium]